MIRNSFLDRGLIFSAAFLRMLGLGMVAVLLAIYLTKLELSKAQIGLVISVGLFGGAFGNLFVTFFGDYFGRRKILVSYAMLCALGGVAVCLSTSFYTILAAAFFGMLNARGKDRGAGLVIETAIMPELEGDQNRTKAFAWFSLIQDIGLALGGLVAGLPTLLTKFMDFPEVDSFRITFSFYALCMFVCGIIYMCLSQRVEVPMTNFRARFSAEGKKIVTKISSLFAIDSLAGGFLNSALVSYYFYERFDVSLESLGIIYFIARVLNAYSYIAAAWISKRIGLINTMVFTHTPSHLLLLGLIIAPNFYVAIGLFLIRELLVEMDVPIKKSYVMAMVKPEERTMASGVTQIVRMAGWAVGPAFAGLLMQEFSNAYPLLIGASMKLVYDGLIFVSFRKIKPPEEQDLKPVLAAA